MFGMKKKELNEANMLGWLVDGLPLQENTDLMLKLTTEDLTITKLLKDKQEFVINLEKITSINFYTNTEIQKIISQSTPGMILGAATFGIVGAMIGGKVTIKDKKVETYFVVIDYSSNGDKQITIRTNHEPSGIKFAEYFKTLKPSTVQSRIEL